MPWGYDRIFSCIPFLSDRLLEVFNSSLHEMKSLGADVINFLNFGHFDELIDENVALGTGMVELIILKEWINILKSNQPNQVRLNIIFTIGNSKNPVHDIVLVLTLFDPKKYILLKCVC